jgi:hypothetical protein
MAENPTNTFSGARAIFRVNTDKVAFASGCSGGEEIQYEPVDVLDNIETQEHVPTGYRVNLSAEVFRTIKGVTGAQAPKDGTYGSLKEMGIFPKAGADPLNVLKSGEMSASITDRLTQKTIMQVERVKAASHNFSVTARGIVGQNVTFVAIRMKDESELA